MASPAFPAFPDEALLHELDPEARLVAAVFRRSLQDVEDRRVDELERDRARSFLRGAGAFDFLCALGRMNPVQVARRVATLTK